MPKKIKNDLENYRDTKTDIDNYWDIGHGLKKKRVLWYFDGNKVVKSPEIAPKRGIAMDHGSYFSGQDIPWSRTFGGRYEIDTGTISIYIPEDAMYRDVPNSVLSALRSNFPNYKHIYVFGRGEPKILANWYQKYIKLATSSVSGVLWS